MSDVAQPQRVIAVAPDALPMLTISYAFSLGEGAENRGNAIAAASPLGRTYGVFESSLEQLHVDLPTKLAFVQEAYVVQPELVGSRVAGTHGRGTLYITTPIHALGDWSVVIVSSVSPESTTVLEVDGRLHTKLIYDSISANQLLAGSSCDPLGQINGIQILQPGHLLLTESNERWSNKSNRSVLLDVTARTAGLKCVH